MIGVGPCDEEHYIYIYIYIYICLQRKHRSHCKQVYELHVKCNFHKPMKMYHLNSALKSLSNLKVKDLG